MSNGPVEPAADLRQLAAILRQTYLALLQEDFAATEALTIVGQIIAANMGGNR